MVDQLDPRLIGLVAPMSLARKTRRLVLASHRGPIEYHQSKSGALYPHHGSGGLVTALNGLSRLTDFTWVAAAMTEGDRLAASIAREPNGPRNGGFRFVTIPREVYSLHYSVFSNPLLWFLHHSLWDDLRRDKVETLMRKGWMGGYLPANLAFARAVAEEIRGVKDPPYVMFQDYHLYMCPAYVREQVPDAVLQHFIHIPWPSPRMWRKVPSDFTSAICRSLLCNDVVGFQTRRCADNFLLTCETFIDSLEIDHSTSSVHFRGHQTKVRTYPISVDVRELRRRMQSPEVDHYRKKLMKLTSGRTIVKVDRLDPIKNVVSGLDAFERLLDEHPDLVGGVKLFAFLVPSRIAIHEYREYSARVRQRIGEINERFGRNGWRPIESFEENNYDQALAGMSLYDVLLVNSVADGMNLVSKEGPIVNQRNGVVVLSKNVGSYGELRDSVLSIDPLNVNDTANALWRALDMPFDEKRRRAQRMQTLIAQRDLKMWLADQLADLDIIAAEKSAAVRSFAGSRGQPGLISA